jgi:phospholipid/cholesterol/gamma-HCH transport system substrate-binding protein
METRAHALIAGSFVLGIVLLGGLLATWLRSDTDAVNLPYLVVSEDSVFGLAEHTAVSYRGVPVGTVEDIRLDREDYDRVLIEVLVDERVPLGRNTYALLRLEGITGSVQLELGDDGDRGPRLETSRDNPARIPVRPSFLGTLETSGQNLVAQLEGLITDLRSLINNPQDSSLSALLATAEEAMSGLVTLEAGIQETVDLLPGLVRQGSETFESIGGLVADANRLIVDLSSELEGVDDVLSGLQRAGDSSGQVGELLAEDTLPRINILLEELGQVSASLGELVRTLERNPQSLIFGSPKPVPAPGERGYRSPPP